MTDYFDSNSATWEEGFSDGYNSAIDLLKVAKKFEDSGYDAEDVLKEKLKEIKDLEEKEEDLK